MALATQDLLARAKSVLAAAQATSLCKQAPTPDLRALILPETTAEWVTCGEVKFIVKDSKFNVEGRRFLVADGHHLHGIATLAAPATASRADVLAKSAEYGLPTATVRALWAPDAELYVYPVVEADAFDQARLYEPTQKRLLQGDYRHFGVTGIHVHSLESAADATQTDGDHYHIFLVDGVLTPTFEDGAHAHAVAGDDSRTSKGGGHTHQVRLVTGLTVATEVETAHAHDLTPVTTAIDGAHQHVLVIDGKRYTSLSAAEYRAALPIPLATLGPSPAASWLAKQIGGEPPAGVPETAQAPKPPVAESFAGFPNLEACVLEMTTAGHYDEAAARHICGKLQAQAELGHGANTVAKRNVRAVVTAVRTTTSGPVASLAIGPVAADVVSTWTRVEKFAEGPESFAPFGRAPVPEGLAVQPGAVVDIEATSVLFSTLPRAFYPVTPAITGLAPGDSLPTTPDDLIDQLHPDEVRVHATPFDAHYGRAVRFKLAAEPENDSSTEQRFVFGIVLEPEVEDAQGDVYNAKEVEAAAHYYMAFHQSIGLMHERILDKGVLILESYVTRCDCPIAGEQVRKGTWLLAARVRSNEVWEQIKSGGLKAYSIGGYSTRTRAN